MFEFQTLANQAFNPSNVPAGQLNWNLSAISKNIILENPIFEEVSMHVSKENYQLTLNDDRKRGETNLWRWIRTLPWTWIQLSWMQTAQRLFHKPIIFY